MRNPQLCLGTVQFGLPYGVTNQIGQVPEFETCQILNLAAASSIQLLDTAQSYGTSERILGRCWPKDAPRRLISKLPAGADQHSWETNLLKSMEYLKTEKLDGFLLHSSSDLTSENGKELLKWLESLRERGLAERIGVSIYEANELNNLPLSCLQLVQLPLSIYDQRMINNGTIDKLLELGISIHARSTFLQGLLLQASEYWPIHITASFKKHHTKWQAYLRQKGWSPLEYALSFVRSIEGLEACLVGVLSQKELEQIIHAWNQQRLPLDQETRAWAWDNVSDLDPRIWPKK